MFKFDQSATTLWTVNTEHQKTRNMKLLQLSAFKTIAREKQSVEIRKCRRTLKTGNRWSSNKEKPAPFPLLGRNSEPGSSACHGGQRRVIVSGITGESAAEGRRGGAWLGRTVHVGWKQRSETWGSPVMQWQLGNREIQWSNQKFGAKCNKEMRSEAIDEEDEGKTNKWLLAAERVGAERCWAGNNLLREKQPTGIKLRRVNE